MGSAVRDGEPRPAKDLLHPRGGEPEVVIRGAVDGIDQRVAQQERTVVLAEDAAYLVERTERIRKVLDHLAQDDGLDRAVAKREPHHVGNERRSHLGGEIHGDVTVATGRAPRKRWLTPAAEIERQPARKALEPPQVCRDGALDQPIGIQRRVPEEPLEERSDARPQDVRLEHPSRRSGRLAAPGLRLAPRPGCRFR